MVRKGLTIVWKIRKSVMYKYTVCVCFIIDLKNVFRQLSMLVSFCCSLCCPHLLAVFPFPFLSPYSVVFDFILFFFFFPVTLSYSGYDLVSFFLLYLFVCHCFSCSLFFEVFLNCLLACIVELVEAILYICSH